MKIKKSVSDMTIDEQALLLSKRIKNFFDRNFRALSASGIVWVDEGSGNAYQIVDSVTVIKLTKGA
jgi:hypothetical protein